MKTIYLIRKVSAFGLFLVLITNPLASAQMLSPEQMRADFKLFRQALEEAHPGIYRYTPKASLDSIFDTTLESLKSPLTKNEFYKILIQNVVYLRCGHTKLLAKGEPEKYPFHKTGLFPLKLYFIGQRAWVEDGFIETVVPKGTEVVSINGETIEAIITRLLPYITFADGNTTTGKYQDLNRYFSGIFSTFSGNSSTYEIVYRQNEAEHTVILDGVSMEAIEKYFQNKEIQQKPIRLTYSEKETAILDIDRFWVMKEELDYEKILKQSFKELKEKGVKNLIIDLRNNEGGSEKFGMLLYSYIADKPFRYYKKLTVASDKKFSFPAYKPSFYHLAQKIMVKKKGDEYLLNHRESLKQWKPSKYAFDGNVYVLINGGSFSVSSEFSSVVQSNKRGVFIGQETSGGYYGDTSGIFVVVPLNNSGLELGVPLIGYYTNVSGTAVAERGIIPDYEVVPSLHDRINDKNAELNFALSLIKK